jgi:hypothetical protein
MAAGCARSRPLASGQTERLPLRLAEQLLDLGFDLGVASVAAVLVTAMDEAHHVLAVDEECASLPRQETLAP